MGEQFSSLGRAIDEFRTDCTFLRRSSIRLFCTFMFPEKSFFFLQKKYKKPENLLRYVVPLSKKTESGNFIRHVDVVVDT